MIHDVLKFFGGWLLAGVVPVLLITAFLIPADPDPGAMTLLGIPFSITGLWGGWRLANR